MEPDEVVAGGALLVRPRLAGARPGHGLEILRDDLLARPVVHDLPVVEQDRAIAELRDRLQVMRHEDNGAPGRADVLHATETAGLKLGVADAQHLVHEHDLRLEVRGDREREAHVHAARVALDRRVEELLDTRELGDLGELRLNLAALHAEDRAVQEHVLAPGELGMEARSDLEQAPDAAADLRSTLASES